MAVALFLLVVVSAGFTGYAVLIRLGFEDLEAAGGGVVAGLITIALPAWWVGSLGGVFWPAVSAAVSVAGGVLGALTLWRRRPSARALLQPVLVVLVFAIVVLVFRLPHPQIEQQEKFMDQGILATLLRARSFPPPDMWLAGETLPYYYLGALLWAVPLRLSGMSLDVGYNLIVALVAGVAAGCLWVLGRRFGGGPAGGVLAAGFGLLAGTPDGFRQVLGGRALWGLDYWASSRQVPDTITEYPLFTLWLGDLHPHLLSIPVAALAILLAAEAGRRGPTVALTIATAIGVGVTWAANPWAMPPTLAAVGLLLLCGDGTFHWPTGGGWRRWLAGAAVAAGAWGATAPFHLAFHPPFGGIGLVRAWTQPLHLVLYAGALAAPAMAVAIHLLRRRLEGQGPRVAGALTAVIAAGAIVLAAASGRPTLILLGLPLVVLAAEVVRPGRLESRPALALAALGLFMLAVPEVVYVVDSYGEALHRMNTVFKSYIQGWVLLAVSLPALLQFLTSSTTVRRFWLAGLLIVSLPHPLSMVAGPFRTGQLGLDGLRWMDPGDRALVEALRDQPGGTTMIEAVGPAYSRHARLSAASGVPAYLGWSNHELVWRGSSVSAETSRREQLVREVYASTEVETVRRLVSKAGVDVVAIGSIERLESSPASIDAIRRAGEIMIEQDGAALIRFSRTGDGVVEEAG